MSIEKQTAVLIGRFQPFHHGHLQLVKQILSECKDLLLVVGSSQENFTPHNPFTTGERIRMIWNSLLYENIDMRRTLLFHISDDENNARWLSNFQSYVPPFNIVYSGNNFLHALLSNEKISLRYPNFISKELYNGTRIRNLMIDNNPIWQNMVPKAVIEIINEIKGVERIQKLSKSWTDSPFSHSRIH